MHSFMCMDGFQAYGLCVLTVLTSIRDPASVGDRRLLEHGHQNLWRLFETRRLIEVLRHTCRPMQHRLCKLYKSRYQRAACLPAFPLKLFAGQRHRPLMHARTLHTHQTLDTLPTDSVDTATTTNKQLGNCRMQQVTSSICRKKCE